MDASEENENKNYIIPVNISKLASIVLFKFYKN